MHKSTTWILSAPCSKTPVDERFTTSPVEQPVDETLQALATCRTCPFQAQCLDAVKPAESYFDGVCAGMLWMNGKRVDEHKTQVPDPVGGAMVGALCFEYTLAELERHLRLESKTLRRWLQDPYMPRQLSWRQRALVRHQYRHLPPPPAAGRLAHARREVERSATEAGHKSRYWWSRPGRRIEDLGLSAPGSWEATA